MMKQSKEEAGTKETSTGLMVHSWCTLSGCTAYLTLGPRHTQHVLYHWVRASQTKDSDKLNACREGITSWWSVVRSSLWCKALASTGVMTLSMMMPQIEIKLSMVLPHTGGSHGRAGTTYNEKQRCGKKVKSMDQNRNSWINIIQKFLFKNHFVLVFPRNQHRRDFMFPV